MEFVDIKIIITLITEQGTENIGFIKGDCCMTDD